jgi:hypothetical protein
MPDGSEMLKALLAHPLLRGAVPDRRRITYADLPLPSEERHRAGIEAIEATPTWEKASDLVRALGQLRHAPAVPTLVRLWERCPVMPVMVAAGHALFEIGTPEAHASLQSALEEAEHVTTFLAIKSIVATDPKHAFDRLERYFSDDALAVESTRAIAGEVLWFFGPASYFRDGATWNLPQLRALLLEDSRWVQTALRLRRHRAVGDQARHLLETLEADDLDAALRRWPDPPPPIRSPYRGPRDFVARYERGERELVWRELFALGPFPDDGLRQEAAEVARATMTRVRANVELVTARLRDIGYSFDDFVPPWTPPSADTEEVIRRIEEAAGGLVPASLRAFWTVVGEVSWKHSEEAESDRPPWESDLDLAGADPLYVLSAGNAWSSVEEWLDRRSEVHPEVAGPLYLDLAPDCLHKANISGGAPYAMIVPSDTADAIFENEAHELPFVEYLRLCFRWGGFPGLEGLELSGQDRDLVDRLRRNLFPF